MPLQLLSPKTIWSKKEGAGSSGSLQSSGSFVSVNTSNSTHTDILPADSSKVDSSISSDFEPLPLPKINTKFASPRQSEASSLYARSPTSPNFALRRSTNSFTSLNQRRIISERVKTTPSSFVRHLRVYSSDFDDLLITSPKRHSRTISQSTIPTETIPPELMPVVTLINSQKLRTYALGSLQIPGLTRNNERVWLEVEAKLSGIELAIWRPSSDDLGIENDEFKPTYVNLADSKISLNSSSNEIRIMSNFRDDQTLLIKASNYEDYIKWVTAIELSRFENTSLNEAFTAVILSLKGSKLSDIHTLLSSKKKFPRFEWCNLRLPQISSKWLKVYMVIMPADSKRKHRIEVYANEKLSKKNLILYISDVTNVFNVYPEHANMIDFNTLMKLSGEINISKHFEHLFHHDGGNTPVRTTSLKGLLSKLPTDPYSAPPKKHGSSRNRSTSVNSTSSFFDKASSPKPEPKDSSKNISSYFKKHMDDFVTASYLYLMPVPHPGVSGVEIMIRNFLHIVDTYGLYGRPSQFISEKSNKASLLFGMPSLPHYEYLSMEDATQLVRNNIRAADQEKGPAFWSRIFKDSIEQKIITTNYKGLGSINDLHDSMDLNYEDISSPAIALPTFEEDSKAPSPNNVFRFGEFSDSSNSADLIMNGLGEPFVGSK